LSDEIAPANAPLAADAGEQPELAAHKLRPWSRTRAFLKEYVIIVVGVLTALAAGQVVEAWHWRQEVVTERASLLDEARENLSAAAYRLAEEPCIDRRLAELEEGLRRQAKGMAPGFRKPFSRPPIWIASTGTWDIAVSGQALSHMAHAEKLSFSDAFDAYKEFSRLRNEEDAVWRRLALVNHPDILSDGDWSELHQALGEAYGENERMASLMAYVVKSAALSQRPLPVAPEDAADLKAFCTTSLFR
jgi:hypothetical protein